MNDTQFKIFQRRGDQLHLGASISTGLLTLNGINIATIAILTGHKKLNAVNIMVTLIVISSVLLVINLICIRMIATRKIETLVEKVYRNRSHNKNSNQSRPKIQVCATYATALMLNPYWKEIVSLVLSAVAFGMTIKQIF